MVTRIALSHDGVNFVETFSNGAYFTTIIEDNNIATDEGFNYGETPQITTLQINYSGTHAQVKEMLSYKHIRAYAGNTLIFAGYNPSDEEKVVNDEVRNGTATYSSYASYFENVTFAEDIEYLYPDGIKLCDPEDTTHSLVHILFNLLTASAPQVFTLDCTYVDTTIIPSFVVSIGDSIYDVFGTLLEQLGLTFCIRSYTIHVIDMLETPSGIAINISDFESGMSLAEKAYETKTLPKIRTCEYHKVTDVQIGQLQNGNNKIVISPHARSYFDVSLQYKAGDNTKVVLYTPKTCKLKGATHGFISGYGVELYGWRKSGPEQVTAEVYNEHALFDYSFQNIEVGGDVAYLDYNNIVIPQDTDPNMPFVLSDEEKKVDYLTTDDQALRYLKALLYGQYMDSRTYEVYTTQDLALNTYCTISGETGFFRIIRKQCEYDAFNGYTYTLAAIFNDGGLQYDSSYVAPVADLPPLRPSIVLQASRYSVTYNPGGTLIDVTPIHIFVNALNNYIQPTLKINGAEVTLTPAPEGTLQTDETTVGDSGWYYDLDPHTFDTYDSIVISAEIVGGDYKEIHISRVDTTLKAISAQYYMSASDTALIPNCFVITHDTEKQSGKIYYEFSVTTGFVITTDATFIDGKTYYEDAGWLDQVVYSTGGNYFLNGEMYPTADTTPQAGKTYYVWDDLTEEYIIYTESVFVQGVTYYEWQDKDSFVWSRQKYLYSDDSTDFSDYSYYLTRADISSAFTLTYLYNISTSDQFVPTEDTTPQAGKEYYINHNGTWEVCDTTSGSFPTSIVVYEIPGAVEWQPNIPSAWNANLYIWIRESIEYERGLTVVNVPRFSLKTTQDMLANCIFDIQLSSYIWERDKRATATDDVEITLTYDIRGYGNATPIITGLPQAVTATTEEGITTLSFPSSLELSSFTFTVSLDGFPQVSSQEFTIEAVDVTNVGKHFEPSNIIKTTTTYEEDGITYNYVKGDYYLYRETAVGADGVIYNTVLQPKYFDGEQWVDMLTMSEKDTNALLQLIPDVFQYANGENVVSIADYSFFKNIVAQNITTELLYSIYIQVGRAIYGGAFQADGTNPTGGQGFHFSKEGILQAFNAILTNATITGHFISNALETKDAQLAGHLTANATGSYIHLQDLFNLLNTFALPEGPADYPAALNAYAGQTFNKIVYKAAASNYSQNVNRNTPISITQGTAVTTPIVGSASDVFVAPIPLKLSLSSIVRSQATYRYNTYTRNGTYNVTGQRWESETSAESGWVSSVPANQQRPSNPQVGATYKTYTQTRHRTYYYWDWVKETTTGSWSSSSYIGYFTTTYPSESRPSNPKDGDSYTTYSSWTWDESEGMYKARVTVYSYSTTTSYSYGSGSGTSVPSDTSTTTYTVTDWDDEYKYTTTTWTYRNYTETKTDGVVIQADQTGTAAGNVLEYRINGGSWLAASTDTIITLAAGDTIVFRQAIAAITDKYIYTKTGDTTVSSIPAQWQTGIAGSVTYTYGLSEFDTGYTFIEDTTVIGRLLSDSTGYYGADDYHIELVAGTDIITAVDEQQRPLLQKYLRFTQLLKNAVPVSSAFYYRAFQDTFNISYQRRGESAVNITSATNIHLQFDTSNLNIIQNNALYASIAINEYVIGITIDVTPIAVDTHIETRTVVPKQPTDTLGTPEKPFKNVFADELGGVDNPTDSVYFNNLYHIFGNAQVENVISRGSNIRWINLPGRPTNANIDVASYTSGAGVGGMTIVTMLATSAMTSNKPPHDALIVTYIWDDGSYCKQMAYSNNTKDIYQRWNTGSAWSAWEAVGGGGNNYVPTSRTVNGKALSSDVTLYMSDVFIAPVGVSVSGTKDGGTTSKADNSYTYQPSAPAVGSSVKFNNVVATCSVSKTLGSGAYTATASIALPAGTYARKKSSNVATVLAPDIVAGGTVLATASASTQGYVPQTVTATTTPLTAEYIRIS